MENKLFSSSILEHATLRIVAQGLNYCVMASPVDFYISYKLSLCLTIEALCHEGVWVNGAHYHFHASAAVLTRESAHSNHFKRNLMPLKAGLEDMKKIQFLTLTGLELLPSGRRARSQVRMYKFRKGHWFVWWMIGVCQGPLPYSYNSSISQLQLPVSRHRFPFENILPLSHDLSTALGACLTWRIVQ